MTKADEASKYLSITFRECCVELLHVSRTIGGDQQPLMTCQTRVLIGSHAVSSAGALRRSAT